MNIDLVAVAGSSFISDSATVAKAAVVVSRVHCLWACSRWSVEGTSNLAVTSSKMAFLNWPAAAASHLQQAGTQSGRLIGPVLSTTTIPTAREANTFRDPITLLD